MTVYIESPPGWAPKQILATRLRTMGYMVTEVRYLGTGEVRLVITGR